MLAMLANAAVSVELWHGASYGMSLPQVLANVSGSYKIMPPVIKPVGTERAEVDHLDVDGRPFNAEFWFHSESLNEVTLRFDRISLKPGDGDWMKAKLTTKYGPAKCSPAPADGFCHWDSGPTRVWMVWAAELDGMPMLMISYDKKSEASSL